MINPEGADNTAFSDGSLNTWLEDWGARAGFKDNVTGAYIMPFLMPTLGEGQEFVSADLQVRLHNIDKYYDQMTFNVDLYGLGLRAASTVLASDYYAGALDASATRLVDDFLTPASPAGTLYHTDAAGDAALLAYLNAQYAGGAGAGQYAFLRLNIDQATYTGNPFYEFTTANAGGDNEKPVLDYTAGAVIPEPATFACLAIGLGVLLRVRRKVVRG